MSQGWIQDILSRNPVRCERPEPGATNYLNQRKDIYKGASAARNVLTLAVTAMGKSEALVQLCRFDQAVILDKHRNLGNGSGINKKMRQRLGWFLDICNQLQGAVAIKGVWNSARTSKTATGLVKLVNQLDPKSPAYCLWTTAPAPAWFEPSNSS
jgi:hypothetical protein